MAVAPLTFVYLRVTEASSPRAPPWHAWSEAEIDPEILFLWICRVFLVDSSFAAAIRSRVRAASNASGARLQLHRLQPGTASSPSNPSPRSLPPEESADESSVGDCFVKPYQKWARWLALPMAIALTVSAFKGEGSAVVACASGLGLCVVIQAPAAASDKLRSVWPFKLED